MGKKLFSIIVVFALVLLFFGCTADTNYQSYNDLKKQGEKVFVQNLRSCKEYSAQNVKRSEGSKAAGELLREKNFIFYSCMKKKYWVPKRHKTKF